MAARGHLANIGAPEGARGTVPWLSVDPRHGLAQQGKKWTGSTGQDGMDHCSPFCRNEKGWPDKAKYNGPIRKNGMD